MFGIRNRFFRGKVRTPQIDPDEVLLDAFNLPSFDTDQFEGRVERSIRSRVPLFVGGVAMVVFSVFLFQAWNLQVARGEAMAVLSERNSLNHEILFAERGVIYDRYGRELAWNVPPVVEDASEEFSTYAFRAYTERPGFSHLLGFVGYPEKDAQGFWWRTEYLGKSGLESTLNDALEGDNGTRIIEVDALSNVQSENTIRAPIEGESVTLSIDADVQEALYNSIRNGALNAGFVGGAGVVMDVKTGEVLALTNYPEYSSQVMTDATDNDAIARYSTDDRQPFLNRAVLGEYTPGSIVKPYIVAAALAEDLVTPESSFFSSGEISIQNPYNPELKTTFKDWKSHGWVDARRALEVSSNVYFYTVGGGYEQQDGLGIEKLARYAAQFGLGVPTGIGLDSEGAGVVPTPAWKREVFGDDDPWRLGNTYHTAIGQFGFLVTPIQATRYISSVANGGSLVTPHLVKDSGVQRARIGVADEHLQVVREGMRQAAEKGTAAAVNVPGIRMAGKTGTAQLGRNNEHMNSWVVGFWPADNPRFAFAAVLEKAPAGTLQGAAPALRSFFDWMINERPDYAQGVYPAIEDVIVVEEEEIVAQDVTEASDDTEAVASTTPDDAE